MCVIDSDKPICQLHVAFTNLLPLSTTTTYSCRGAAAAVGSAAARTDASLSCLGEGLCHPQRAGVFVCVYVCMCVCMCVFV